MRPVNLVIIGGGPACIGLCAFAAPSQAPLLVVSQKTSSINKSEPIKFISFREDSPYIVSHKQQTRGIFVKHIAYNPFDPYLSLHEAVKRGTGVSIKNNEDYFLNSLQEEMELKYKTLKSINLDPNETPFYRKLENKNNRNKRWK